MDYAARATSQVVPVKVMERVDYIERGRRRGLGSVATQAEVEHLVRRAREEASKTLDLSGYDIDQLPHFQELEQLEVLNFHYTSVSDLAPIEPLVNLKKLGFSRTQVQDITQISSIPLETLDFDGSPVACLAPLANLPSLKLLSCRSVRAVNFTPLESLAALETLYCAGSKFEDFSFATSLTNLRVINCTNCGLKDFDKLGLLEKLTWLYCGSNRVDDIDCLKNLINLKTLSLYSTDVADITALGSLSQLQYLDLQRTKIAHIEPLANLNKLREIELDYTDITDISPLSKMKFLTSLSCNKTKIKSLAPLIELSNLESLHANETHIDDLSPLSSLRSLKRLDCSFTSPAELPEFSENHNIESINVSNTLIRDLAPLARAATLEAVDFSSTRVTDISPLISLPKLRSVTCNLTKLSRWPPEMFDLPALAEVYAREARIGSIPAEDLSIGYGDNCLPRIRSYFDDLAAGAVPLERVKIIVLGNGQVGKTQLRRWLMNSPEQPSPFDPDVPSTHGIEVLRGSFAVPDAEGDGRRAIDASIWDFGGQDIYHGTHTLFMKTRAVFVLCWCPEHEDKREQSLGGMTHQNEPMAYWVDYVRQLSGTDVPLIIVQTQCDSASTEQPHRHAAINRTGFDFVKFVQFSAKTGRGGASLREAIGDAEIWLKGVHGIPLIGSGRASVLDQLEKWRSEDARRPSSQREHKLLTQEQFKSLCSSAGGIAQPGHLLNFLHHAGVVFYREGLFEDSVILDQDWALAAIYSALDRRRFYPLLKALRGRFTAELIGALAWQGYSRSEQQLFLSLMESCGIAFLHWGAVDERFYEYIAPDLLPTREEVAEIIESRWRGSEPVLSVRLRFALLHKGLMRGILSSIGRRARINAEYWRSGVLFYDSHRQSDAMIEAVQDDEGWAGDIVISCRSGRAQELIHLLVEDVQRVATQLGLTPQRSADEPEPAPVVDDMQPPLEFAPPPRAAPRWYVSYAWGDDSPEGRCREARVDQLCQEAERRGTTILRDSQVLRTNDSIRRFMDELTGGDRIIVILSDKYLRSPYCMFELYQTWRKQQSDPDLFATVVRVYRMPDAAIGTAAGRGGFGKYWAEKVEEDRQYLDYLGARDTEEWHLARHYALDVADILHMINDRVSPREWEPFLDWAFAAD